MDAYISSTSRKVLSRVCIPCFAAYFFRFRIRASLKEASPLSVVTITTFGDPDGAFVNMGRAASESLDSPPKSFATSQKNRTTAPVIIASERGRIRLNACTKKDWLDFAEKAGG